MKLNSCTTIELKDERLRCLRRLCGLADKMAKIDAILDGRGNGDVLKGISQPKLLTVLLGY